MLVFISEFLNHFDRFLGFVCLFVFLHFISVDLAWCERSWSLTL